MNDFQMLEYAWAIGAIMYDPYRAQRIAAATNWHRVLTPELEEARAAYDLFESGKAFCPFLLTNTKPASGVEWFSATGFHSVSREAMVAVWRERQMALRSRDR